LLLNRKYHGARDRNSLFLNQLQFLIDNGAEIDELGSISEFRRYGFPLLVTSAYKYFDFVALLLKNGADPDCIYNGKKTPLSVLKFEEIESLTKISKDYQQVTNVVVELLNYNANPYVKGCEVMEEPVVFEKLLESKELIDENKLLAYSYFLDRSVDLDINKPLLEKIFEFDLSVDERGYFIQQLNQKNLTDIAEKLKSNR
jgi:hypothetical protein